MESATYVLMICQLNFFMTLLTNQEHPSKLANTIEQSSCCSQTQIDQHQVLGAEEAEENTERNGTTELSHTGQADYPGVPGFTQF